MHALICPLLAPVASETHRPRPRDRLGAGTPCLDSPSVYRPHRPDPWVPIGQRYMPVWVVTCSSVVACRSRRCGPQTGGRPRGDANCDAEGDTPDLATGGRAALNIRVDGFGVCVWGACRSSIPQAWLAGCGRASAREPRRRLRTTPKRPHKREGARRRAFAPFARFSFRPPIPIPGSHTQPHPYPDTTTGKRDGGGRKWVGAAFVDRVVAVGRRLPLWPLSLRWRGGVSLGAAG